MRPSPGPFSLVSVRDLGLTFAGGGNRAFYQLGLLERFGERIWPRVAAVAGCSAGACMATILLAGRAEQTHAFWVQRRADVTRNLDLTRLLRGQRPAPHGDVYGDTLRFAYSEGGLERIREQPFPIWVMTAAPPARLPAAAAVWVGMGAYALEKRLKPTLLHPTLPGRLGFSERVFDARDCESPEELADLVLASSATPPFTPIGNVEGQLLLDGGLVDNAPAELVDRSEGVSRTLVLLTRGHPFGGNFVRGKRLYLAPREPVPIERWDYTRADLVEATIELGRRDAEHHEGSLQRFLC